MSTHRLNQQIQKKDERVDSLGQEHFDLQNTLTKYNTYLSEVMKIENPKEIVTTALGFLEIKLQEIEEGSELDFTLLNRIEVFLDRLFEKFDLDIEFTHHFFNRLNGPRNGKTITGAELIRIFQKVYEKYGKDIALKPVRIKFLQVDY
ncbi:MAG: hypothetical protein KAR21_15745 [Spirochaetales bacterium]|nr:hypothetical protein [Spirochaetales bacterium]